MSLVKWEPKEDETFKVGVSFHFAPLTKPLEIEKDTINLQIEAQNPNAIVTDFKQDMFSRFSDDAIKPNDTSTNERANIGNSLLINRIPLSGLNLTDFSLVDVSSKANQMGIVTGCIVCNKESAVAAAAKYPIEVIVGPEFVTGSTRMKAGTAQKLVLNMISTAVMIGLGRVKGNKMFDMQLSNQKLVERAVHMVMEASLVDAQTAQELLEKYGSVREAVKHALNP